MRQNHAEIVCVLDRSGSMASICMDSIGGFNTFLDAQRSVPGTANVSVVIFDDQYEMLYDGIDVKKADKLTIRTFMPRGMTALYDAIGRTITDVGERLSALPEADRPEKVLVVILTDGGENSSKEFNFLGANQDSFLTAGGIGISHQYTSNYAATGAGVKEVYRSLTKSVTSYRAN
jgi:uncharacterized protein YegL